MFNVYANYAIDDDRIERNTMYQVCAVQNDSKGFPQFLIYAGQEWIWKSAKYFHI